MALRLSAARATDTPLLSLKGLYHRVSALLLLLLQLLLLLSLLFLLLPLLLFYAIPSLSPPSLSNHLSSILSLLLHHLHSTTTITTTTGTTGPSLGRGRQGCRSRCIDAIFLRKAASGGRPSTFYLAYVCTLCHGQG